MKMAQLFIAIHEAVKDVLLEDGWLEAHQSALRFLIQFAQQKPVPNVNTAPAQTLMAAAYLAILMLADDNITCSLVMLDGANHYGGECFQLGI